MRSILCLTIVLGLALVLFTMELPPRDEGMKGKKKGQMPSDEGKKKGQMPSDKDKKKGQMPSDKDKKKGQMPSDKGKGKAEKINREEDI